MTNIENTLSEIKRLDPRFFSVLREIGLLLLTVSLLFLPWFRDPYPPIGRPPLVTGIEFIKYGSWPVPLAYALAVIAYSVSKFSKSKWAGVIPFIGAFFVYFYIFINTYYTRFDPPGIPLDRWNSLADKHFTLSVGMWFNWIGLLALVGGFYYAEIGGRRRAIPFGLLGAFAGIILYILTSMLLKPEELFMTSVQAYAFPIIGTIMGSWLFSRKNPDGKHP